MKALSIRQPWAWLIVHGYKDVENRTWCPSFRGEFYIHSPQKLYGTQAERDQIRQWVWRRSIVMPPDHRLKVGGIVGRAVIVDVVERSLSPWFVGPYGLVLDNMRPVKFTECNGRLGFFDVGGQS